MSEIEFLYSTLSMTFSCNTPLLDIIISYCTSNLCLCTLLQYRASYHNKNIQFSWYGMWKGLLCCACVNTWSNTCHYCYFLQKSNTCNYIYYYSFVTFQNHSKAYNTELHNSWSTCTCTSTNFITSTYFMDKNFNLTIRLFLYMLNWCKELSEEDLRKIETCWEFW